MKARPIGTEPITNRAVISYFITMLLGVTLVQIYSAVFAGNRIELVSTLILAVVAIYYWIFSYTHAKQMRLRAYSRYFTHVLAYLLVNGSYWIHAALLVVSQKQGLLDGQWASALFGMSIFWGFGLLAHTLGTFLSRGYEDVNV
jgi:heme/copper-type cytochrome/quinol oxidase subunit 4